MADVVVVEDNQDIATLVEMILADAGHTVRVARDGEAGLILLVHRLPDVLVTDVEMPVLDGPGLAMRMLLENAGKEKVPIILMSGAQGLAEIASRIGIPYVLAKPFGPNALLVVLATALHERRAPRPPSSSARA